MEENEKDAYELEEENLELSNIVECKMEENDDDEGDDSIIKDQKKKVQRKIQICLICGAEFKRRHQLDYHMSQHTGKAMNECEVCGKTFTTKQYLIAHGRIHRGEKLYICDQCGMSLSDRSAFKNHLLRHKGDKNYICKICQKAFTTNSNLSVHMKSHSTERVHSCSYCEKKFHFKSGLRRHIDRIHSIEKSSHLCSLSENGSVVLTKRNDDSTDGLPFTCNICNKEFGEKGIFKRHIMEHPEKKHYHCGICSIHFKAEVEFDKHTIHHSGRKMHTCVVCSRIYLDKYSLTMHIKACHKETKSKEIETNGQHSEPVTYDLCGEKQNSADNDILVLDFVGNKEPKVFKCEECSEVCENRFMFYEHLKFHDKGRPFVCGYCGKRFVRSCNLKVHTKWHKRLQEFNENDNVDSDDSHPNKQISDTPVSHKCGSCGETFSDDCHHSCEKIAFFKCEECSEGFQDKNQLEQHMKFHDKSRPFECPFCGKRYVKAANLKVHTTWHLKMDSGLASDIRLKSLFQNKRVSKVASKRSTSKKKQKSIESIFNFAPGIAIKTELDSECLIKNMSFKIDHPIEHFMSDLLFNREVPGNSNEVIQDETVNS